MSVHSIQNKFPNSPPSAAQAMPGLETYTGPWTKTQAAHLIRRAQVGLKINQLNYARSFDQAETAVQALINNAVSQPLPDDPQWYTSGNSGDVQDIYDIQFRWMDTMYNGGLLQPMMLFWTNHFAVSYNNMNALPDKAPDSYASHIYKYWKLLYQYSFGNFKQLLRLVSKNSAMLYYLNNSSNQAGQPNEDFARELLELFTMGTHDKNGNSNYSETDVAEVARAVTGWRVSDINLTGYFDSGRHDNTDKTIFGRTGNYDLDGVIDLIFEVRKEETAWFLCKKLYVFFVSAEPNAVVIDDLAAYCIQQNFDTAAVVAKLLSSAHFYDESFYGCRIKSPSEIFLGYLRELEIVPDSQLKEYLRLRMQDLNEELLRPQTVFGWAGYNPPDSDGTPGHYAWLNTNLLPSRWDNLKDIIYGYDEAGDAYNPIRITEKISNPSNPFDVAEDIAQHLLAPPLDKVGVREVEEDFAGNPNLAPDVSGFSNHKINLTKILLGNIPWYEWTANSDQEGNLYYQATFAEHLRAYISYLQQLPAYQLT
ncbi:MAG: DUF1800 domain-containing protein [Balneolaceae bacterium]|nr:DUF1800 domain-containing protein [Balneolaceae bacterium]